VIEVPVEQVMSATVRTVTTDATARRVSERLSGHRIGSLVVTAADGPSEPVGLVTESDIVRIVASGQNPDEVLVESFMSAPVVTVGPDATVQEAARLMREHGFRRLPVVDRGLLGIVTASDLTNYIPRLRDRIATE
jgi:CBS domain-containing protein